MKVFFVNGHKTVSIECGIAVSKCPVVGFMNNNGIAHNTCNNEIRIQQGKQACLRACKLRENIMNICMECNVPER